MYIPYMCLLYAYHENNGKKIYKTYPICMKFCLTNYSDGIPKGTFYPKV